MNFVDAHDFSVDLVLRGHGHCAVHLLRVAGPPHHPEPPGARRRRAAQPFAESLIGAGTQLGIDRFLLVQWLAPLASEAPEFIIAILFAARGKGTAAIATLISSKVNQWTLLIGSLPVAYMIGGGGAALQLDGRQIEEVLLTATQTMMGITLILGLRFHRTAAWALLALFVVQFPIPSTTGRLTLCGVYAALAVAGLILHRRHLAATVMAPFIDHAKRHGGPPRRQPSRNSPGNGRLARQGPSVTGSFGPISQPIG